jgi:hypothetical protein
MNILIFYFLVACFIQFSSPIGINQSILIETYLYEIDSIEIDLSRRSIDSIDINTFKGYSKLEKLFLEDNKFNKLEYGLFNHLSNLRELWLENVGYN